MIDAGLDVGARQAEPLSERPGRPLADPGALIAQIKRLYDHEAIKPLPVTRRGQIPFRYEYLTKGWLTDVLCDAQPGAYVESFVLSAPTDGTTNRCSVRVNYNDVGEARDLETAIFCKGAQDLRNRIALAIAGCAHAETHFYRYVRPLLDVEAPSALFADYDRETYASIFLLRDISNAVSFCDHRTPISYEEASSQIGELARIHGQGCHRAASGVAGLYHWSDFWLANTQLGLEEYCAKGLEAAGDLVPASLFNRRDEVWARTMEAAERHRALPNTLTHNDVHLKNWYKVNGGGMGLADWQCCARGHWSRDLAYTIGTSLCVDDRRLWEMDLIKLYVDLLAQAGGQAATFDESFFLYRQQMVSALAYWTCTLTPTPNQPDMQPEETSLEFIRRIATAIDDLQGLDAF